MKEIKIEKCPFCGGEQMIETKMCSYGRVTLSPTENGGLFCHSDILATVCRDCGSVVRFYCENVEKLYSKKERRK